MSNDIKVGQRIEVPEGVRYVTDSSGRVIIFTTDEQGNHIVKELISKEEYDKRG